MVSEPSFLFPKPPFDKLAIILFFILSVLKLHRIGLNNSIDIPSMNDKFNFKILKIYLPSLEARNPK